MHMHVAWLTVSLKLEMMMFEIGETVTHVVLAGCYSLRPDYLLLSLDADLPPTD